MPKKKEKITIRACVDCGRDISNLHHNALRCKGCSNKRKQQQDQQRHKEKREKTLQWLFFIENPETQELTHQSARGSKLRYWLDKICKQLTIQELEFLLLLWDWRVREPLLPPPQKREYRTCAGIVRDWRDYNVINQVVGNISFDAETGVIFNPDGSYLTVDFDEDNEAYLIRNSEGTIICKY
jgi:DNA-directed RNA polymerase subunit RPC12/RpoP